ncbi:MAG: 4Fe-4S double cluster binding domain-containing protein [Methanoregulaceae archaeon]
MDLADQLRVIARENHADYYGIADLTSAESYIRDMGGDLVAGYPRAVSCGLGLPDSLVNLLPERTEHPVYGALYRHHAYDVVNARLDQISLDIASVIQKAGYAAFPIPASKRADDAKVAGLVSHKLAANLAGLGWIGKSCLLVTPDHGPRVRWCTVLTNAPLEPTGAPMKNRCGECTVCRDACPIHAITGRPFDPDEPREMRLDARACDRFFREMEQSGKTAVCGMCLFSCPWGKRGNPPSSNRPG